MPLPKLSELLGIVSTASPRALLDRVFPFWRKPAKPAVSKRTVAAITHAVHRFLESRGVTDFKVYTLAHQGKPVVLIQAIPQKKLRFSNILEIQLKRSIRAQLGKEVPAVFWRFKTDQSEAPGPEQADYDEQPGYPQDMAPRVPTQAVANELYDVRYTTGEAFEVEEISRDEFDEFLKEAAPAAKKDGE